MHSFGTVQGKDSSARELLVRCCVRKAELHAQGGQNHLGQQHCVDDMDDALRQYLASSEDRQDRL
jgi:hypothetical protein